MKLMYLDNLKQQKCFEYEVILNNKWIYNADKVYKGWQSCQKLSYTIKSMIYKAW